MAPKSSATNLPGLDKVKAAVESDHSVEEEALGKQVDEIMADHPDMTAQDLLTVPEVNTRLAGFFKALSQSQELQNRMNASIAFAATMKNLQGPKENWKFSMDLSSYDKPRTHRLLTSLMSENPARVMDFFEHEVTQATTEFTFDPASKRSTNGVSIESNPVPAPKE